MAVIAWTEIEALYNIRKYTASHPEILNGQSVVHYRPKVKLHGTNAAIQCHPDGRIVAQSRTNELSIGNDNAGFAKWVKDNEDIWRNVPKMVWAKPPGIVVYGEWCGTGIQKGVAISDISKKIFAVFAVRSMTEGSDSLIVEPELLCDLITPSCISANGIDAVKIPDTYVLPWYNEGIDLDWSKSAEELLATATQINEWVGAIEVNDPWVEENFNVKGTGEGLVFYPTSKEHLGLANFTNLVFKAKGEKHKNIKTAAPAQLDPEVASSIGSFIDMVLTEARLEQGVRAVTGELRFDARFTGDFVKWIAGDVKKETQDELEASKLDWKQVQKPLSEKARNWYLSKARV